MKSARTVATTSEQDCSSHPYCVHQHYQKCQTGRTREISYNFFPKQKLNASVNVHPKMVGLKNLNFETLAYEKYVKGKEPETQSERNFVKHFYLENVPDQMAMTNQIVKECEQETYQFNAYNLAQGATKDYYAFEFKRKQYLQAAQKRARINSNLFVKELRDQNQKSLDERAKWIQKIMATLQNLGERMFNLASSNKENEQENGKERIFMNEKSHVDGKYLKEYKLQNPEAASKIFEDLRANMLKKKKLFEDEKIKNNRKNDLTSSQISETTNQSSNTTSQSMISGVSEADQQMDEEKVINELCDFESLKKKWKTLDVERIKDLILSSMTRKIITSCEGERAKIISTYKKQEKQCKSIPGKEKQQNTKNQGKKQRSNTVVNKSDHTQKPVIKILYRNDLTKQQEATKDSLIKAGQFGALGQKYQKTRNYSNLFIKKQESMKLDFTFLKNSEGQKTDKHQAGAKIKFFEGTKNENVVEKSEGLMKGYRTTRANSMRM